MTYKIYYWTGCIDRNMIRRIRENADDVITTRAIIKAAAHCGNDETAIKCRLGLA